MAGADGSRAAVAGAAGLGGAALASVCCLESFASFASFASAGGLTGGRGWGTNKSNAEMRVAISLAVRPFNVGRTGAGGGAGDAALPSAELLFAVAAAAI